LFCTEKAAASLISWEPINERLLVARFGSKVGNISMVMCYAPTEAATTENKDEFYARLNELMEGIPSHDVKMVMGDLNAKVGAADDLDDGSVGRHGLGVRNDNGTRFVEFCETEGLVVGGTLFPHRDVHKATWRSPNMIHTNQIDHITVSKRHRFYLKDVRAYRGADIGQTDHYLVMAKVRVKLKRVTRVQPDIQFNSSRLANNTVREKFRIEVRNRFQQLQEDEDGDVEAKWTNIRDTYREVAEEVLGRRKRFREEWISEETWTVIEEKKKLKIQMESSSDVQVRRRFKDRHGQKAREVKRLARRDKRRYNHEKAEEAERAAAVGDHRTLHRIAKELGGLRGIGGREGMINDGNGRKIS
jgi:hypothetical protein